VSGQPNATLLTTGHHSQYDSNMDISHTSQDTSLETLETLDLQTLENLDFQTIIDYLEQNQNENFNYLEQIPNNSTTQNQNFNCKICHDNYGTPDMCFHPEIHCN